MTIDQTDPALTAGEEIVIFLVAQDDVSTIRTKLEQVHGKRVALVVPPFSLPLRRGIAMRLLRRIAEGFAIELSIVTADGEVQRLSRDEGLPVFASVRAFRRYADRAALPVRPPKAVRVGFDKGTRLLVGVGTIVAMTLFVLILAFALIPVANVTLRPATDPIGETIDIRADPAANSIDYVGRRVPARALYEMVDGTDQVPATGAGQASDARAQGRVMITNRTAEEVLVPAGTILLTPQGVKFVLLEEVRLPPALRAWGRSAVQAVDPGTKGNVLRGAISTVEGPLAQKVDVFNEEPTDGGGATGIGLVTESDRKRLRDQLLERLGQQAMAKLQADVHSSETLLPQAVKIDVLEENYDRRVNEPAKAVNLQMVVRIHGTAFEEPDAKKLGERAWQPRLRTGFAIVPDSVKLQTPEFVRLEGPSSDVVVLRERVDGIAAARVDDGQVTDTVRGRRAPEVVVNLSRLFVLSAQPEVRIEPGWANRAYRVHVEIKSQ